IAIAGSHLGFVLAGFHLHVVVTRADRDLFVALRDLFGAVALLDRDLFVAFFHDLGAVLLDADRLIVDDDQIIVVLNFAVEILLGVKVNILAVLLIFDVNLVGNGLAALRAAR